MTIKADAKIFAWIGHFTEDDVGDGAGLEGATDEVIGFEG